MELNILLRICIIAPLVCNISCGLTKFPTGVKERLNFINTRIDNVEIRIGMETKYRQEDTTMILESIAQVEERLNASLVCNEHEASSSGEMTIEDNQFKDLTDSGVTVRLLKAFGDEKSKSRSDIRKQNMQIDNMKRSIVDQTSRIDAIHVNYISQKAEIDAIEDTMAIDSAKYIDIVLQIDTLELDLFNQNDMIHDLQTDNTKLKAQILELHFNHANELKKLTDLVYVMKGTLLKTSCLEYVKSGATWSGIYLLKIGETTMEVFCDQETDGGGWLVFQRRKDGSEDFRRGWDEYKHGFGNLSGEFWLGNEKLSSLLSRSTQELRVDLEDFENDHRYAKYSTFQVKFESDDYEVVVSGYSGDAGDSFGFHNGAKFATHDKDNDKNCADSFNSGWWFTDNCFYCHLNGKYKKGETEWSEGVNWYHFKGYKYSLKFAEMKFR